MSNLSELILFAGYGHPYDGVGLIIQASVVQHMKKGGWFIQGSDRSVYWPNSALEDAFLMLGLYALAGADPRNPFHSLQERARQVIQANLDEGVDTKDPRQIDATDLDELRTRNGRLLAESGLKIVAVRLGGRSLRFAEGDRVREEFIALARRYNLKNVEFCETIFGRFFGSFSQDVDELDGPVAPRPVHP
jgi:hypothetical protein